MKHLFVVLLRFQALRARERVLAVLAAVVALTVLLDTTWFGPQRRNMRALTQQLEQQESARSALSEVLSNAGGKLPPHANTAERDDLRLRVARAEAALGPVLGEARLSEVVRALVAERSDLALVSLKTLAPEAVARPQSVLPSAPQNTVLASEPNAQAALYKHGVEVVVRGDYPALMAYLENLHYQPYRIFWAKAKLDVQAYPQAVLMLTLYTVSDLPDVPLS